MIDPVSFCEEVGKVVNSGEKRKYYRFRPAPYYGGIATADCVGCYLRCLFCWSWHIVTQPQRVGRFYSPEEVSQNLISIARRKGFQKMRLSGNEPTINRFHLLKILELIPEDIQFILETNGILIGHDSTYAKDLSSFPNLYVRVSIKGASSEDFTRLTGARPEGFDLQLRALLNMIEEGIDCFPAVMANFSSQKDIENLRKRLKAIDSSFYEFEEEELILYPFVEENLKKASLCWTGG